MVAGELTLPGMRDVASNRLPKLACVSNCAMVAQPLLQYYYHGADNVKHLLVYNRRSAWPSSEKAAISHRFARSISRVDAAP